jgi:hypothetical protein
MFDPNVEVNWPEPEEEKRMVLESLVAIPSLKFAHHKNYMPLAAHFISGEAKCCYGNPNYSVTRVQGYGQNVRDRNHMAFINHKSPEDFAVEHWGDVMGAAEAALKEAQPAMSDHEANWYVELWPYFRSAVRNAAKRYTLKAELKLSGNIDRAENDYTVNVLPNVLNHLQVMRDELNAEDNDVVNTIRKSLVRVWVAKFTCEAEAHRYRRDNPVFTKKQARKYLRGAADLCRKNGTTVEVSLYYMPETRTTFSPLRVANWWSKATICVSPKTYQWDGGKQVVTRVEYNMRRTMGGSDVDSTVTGSFQTIVDYIASFGDYNATMKEFGDDPYQSS